jgi:glycosyltransferase involved in cell wall biosynthesis
MNNIGGHELYLKSTNNLEHFPDDLRQFLVPGYHGVLAQGPADYIKENGEQIKVGPKSPLPHIKDKGFPYDLELAYTIFYQFPRRFFPQSLARAGIWNFESSVLPPGWHLYHHAIDYVLPSSQYSYDIFAKNNIPESKMLVVPHGVDTNVFNSNIPPFELRTEKKIKFLHNAIPHARKCHDRMIKAYLDAFTGDDDVCLVMKTKFKEPDKDKPFEVNVERILEEAYKGRKNPPEIEIINSYIPDIGSLYTACDAVVSMSSCEGFWLPGLEALACGMLVIAPNHGGQLEFLNENNSLLINTNEMKAPISMQYWTHSPDAVVGDPDTRHCSELMRRAYENMDEEKERIKGPAKETTEKFSWENAAQMILDLPIPKKSSRINNIKKILYIIPYTMAGGGEVWVKNAINSLDKSKYEPHIAYVSGESHELKELFSDTNAIIHDLSKQGRGHALKAFIESYNFSLVHFYNSFGVYNVIRQAWSQGYRCRIVETVHSELSWADSMTKVATRDKLISAIISVSNSMGRKLLKNGNKNVAVLPQQIDWSRFEVSRSKEILKNLNIKEDFVVGYVGRLSPEKNLSAVIKCASILKDVAFVLVGDGPQGEALKQVAGSLENVYFVGRQENVEDFYAAFDVLMLPSAVEGLPLVILEAMACGTPIIASDVGAISEIVNDGINGSLVWNPGAHMLFAKEIRKLREDGELWKQYSNNSKNFAKAMKRKCEEYTINQIYDALFKGA